MSGRAALGARDHLRREAGAAHPEQHHVRDAVGDGLGGERLDLLDAAGEVVRRRQPAEAVADPGRVVRPEGVVARLQAARDVLAREPVERLAGDGLDRAEAALAAGAAGTDRGQRLVDAAQQRQEVRLERVETVDEQLVRHRGQVDARIGEGGERRLGLGLVVARDRVRGVAVVGEGVERGLGQRVHRVRRDEVVDVEDVGVGGVLRAGRGPERALDARAGGGEAVPGRAGEDLGEAPVGGARVGDARPPAQRRIVRQPPVHLRFDARYEERGDRGDRREVAPRLEGAFESGDVGARDALVDGDVEEQRDVDVDALADQALDGLRRVGGTGHLDHHVGAADRLDKAARLGDRALRVVLDTRRQLERDVAVLAAPRLVDRPQGVGGAAQVGAGEAHEGVVGVAHPGVGQRAQLVVVVRGARDRLAEDGRVGGQPGDPGVVDQALQLAGIEEAAADEIEPGALALLVQKRQRLAHGQGPPRTWGAGSRPPCAHRNRVSVAGKREPRRSGPRGYTPHGQEPSGGGRWASSCCTTWRAASRR